MADKNTAVAAVLKSPLKAKTIPMQPQKRLAQVMAFGMCLLIKFGIAANNAEKLKVYLLKDINKLI